MVTPISRVFDEVLKLSDTEKIILNFTDINELKSKKQLLFLEKKKFEKSEAGSIALKTIRISQVIDNTAHIYQLHLSVLNATINWFTDAVVETKGGETRKLFNKVSKEEERIKKFK